MNIPPEILFGCAVGWVLLAIMSAYFWGKMKGTEPRTAYDLEELEYGDDRIRLDERPSGSVNQDLGSNPSISTKAGREDFV